MKLIRLGDIPITGISHNQEIKERVLIEKGALPHLMMFSYAVLQPGQSIEAHQHETMAEVFFVLSGQALFHVGNEDVVVSAGDCLTVGTGELHSQENISDAAVEWLYFGVATE
ncbi:MAG: cupin domain-containing protein [Patescibacteria group bacterium]|nr:cupin domain-containing protein [Patescibacteria group bacterium]